VAPWPPDFFDLCYALAEHLKNEHIHCMVQRLMVVFPAVPSRVSSSFGVSMGARCLPSPVPPPSLPRCSYFLPLPLLRLSSRSPLSLNSKLGPAVEPFMSKRVSWRLRAVLPQSKLATGCRNFRFKLRVVRVLCWDISS